MTTATIATGTCAYCLRPDIALKDGNTFPVRHGFRAHNVHHGGHGGWHTGPCRGGDFPHFGISPEGTRALEADLRAHLDGLARALENLAAGTDTFRWERTATRSSGKASTWYEVQPGAAAVYLKPEAPAHPFPDRVPAYADLAEARRVALTREQTEAEEALQHALRAITGWKATPAKARAKVGSVTHLGARWKGRADAVVTGACTQWALRMPRSARLAPEGAAPTCKRCLKLWEERQAALSSRPPRSARSARRSPASWLTVG